MGRISISKKQINEFKSTPGGIKKYMWMLGGATIDIVATVGISILVNNAYRIINTIYFYIMLFVFLIIIILGGELMGIYFGALEQFVYDKNQKKVLDIDE